MQRLRTRLWQDWRHLPTHRRVWALALPMILSNLTVPLVSLVDTAVAGHLPETRQLAAVAVGAAVFTLLAWVCGFLRMGTTGLASQAAGRRDGDAVHSILVKSLLLAAFFGLALTLIAWPLLPAILRFMHTEADLQTLALRYLHIRLVGLPFEVLNYALAGWFLGMQNARVAFAMLMVTNLINIVLNLLFVLAFHWGVAGIAWASVLGAVSGSLLGVIRAPRQLARYGGAPQWRDLRNWCKWRAMVLINGDIFIRSLALQGVYFSFTTVGTRLGTDIVAANALLLNGLMLTSFALDGLANAVEAMSGHAIGAGDHTALRRGLLVCGLWCLAGSTLFTFFFLLFGHLFIDLQTNIARVREVAYQYLTWLTALPLVAVWSFFLDGLFVGATRTQEMRNCMLASCGVFLLLLGGLQTYANQGLWLAFFGFMVMRGLSMLGAAYGIYRKRGWVASSAV